MKALVGMFQRDENVQSTIHKLKDAGFAEDRIRVLTDYETVQKLFSSYEGHQVIKYVVSGAVSGIAVLLLFGLTLGGYVCSTLFGHIPTSFLTCVLVGSVGLGLILGASAGWFIGISRFERGVDQYTHGVCQGYKLMALKLNNGTLPKVTEILHQENAKAVKTFDDLQEELNEPIWQKEW